MSEPVQKLQPQPSTFWLTGLSGAGKSTLAAALAVALRAAGEQCFVLDGDEVRQGLCRDLGFSVADRSENIRRVAEVARLMNRAGVTVIAAFISPFVADRAHAREVIGADRFLEIHLSASLTVCEQRDPKGLYRRARRGELADFTGIDSAYEAPASPALNLDTNLLSVQDCVARCLALRGLA